MFADIPLWFAGLVLIGAIVSGATASVVGFGIGSLLTPIFAVRFGTGLAVAAVPLLTKVDCARRLCPLSAIAAAGVVTGTLVGERVLFGLSPAHFSLAVASAIGTLGRWFLLRAA